MTENEIREALGTHGIEVTLRYDFIPSSQEDTAAYQALDFHERVWRALVLTATGRTKMSKQLNERQRALYLLGSGRTAGGLRVRVLTLDAALRLQKAGYTLSKRYSRPGTGGVGARSRNIAEGIH
jgi:hypothetical protein